MQPEVLKTSKPLFTSSCSKLFRVVSKALLADAKKCNFAAELKYVAYREKLIDIQRDNTFGRELSNRAKRRGTSQKQQSAYHQAFALSKYFRNTFENWPCTD